MNSLVRQAIRAEWEDAEYLLPPQGQCVAVTHEPGKECHRAARWRVLMSHPYQGMVQVLLCANHNNSARSALYTRGEGIDIWWPKPLKRG